MNLRIPLELSVQEFVSCSDNAGCNGGSIQRTLEWLETARFNGSQVGSTSLFFVLRHEIVGHDTYIAFLLLRESRRNTTCFLRQNILMRKERVLASMVTLSM